MYLPALSIVAVVFLLLVLVSISTYRNLNREKTQALHFFYRQEVALLRSIEAGARTGMKSLMWQEISLGNLLQETAKDKLEKIFEPFFTMRERCESKVPVLVFLLSIKLLRIIVVKLWSNARRSEKSGAAGLPSVFRLMLVPESCMKIRAVKPNT